MVDIGKLEIRLDKELAEMNELLLRTLAEIYQAARCSKRLVVSATKVKAIMRTNGIPIPTN